MAAVALTAIPAITGAQSVRGSYFFETSLQRGRLNAAFAPQNNYVSIPLLGFSGADAVSNIGLGNFVFPSGGKAYNFMNENVADETFFSKLPESDPYFRNRIESDVLGGGFRIGNDGYVTVAASVLEESSLVIPNDFLRFAKLNQSATVQGPYVDACLYGVISAGYSHDLSSIVEGLHLGARVKVLTGLAAAEVDIRKISVTLEHDMIAAQTDGGGTLVGMKFANKKIRPGNIGINGIGVAFDLGFEYRIKLDGFINGINISASANDLGGKINFNNAVSKLSPGASASYTGLGDLSGDRDLKADIDRIVKDFSELTNISSSEGGSYSHAISPSYYAGIEVPFLNEMVSLGALYYRTMGFNNLMVSCNVSPARWLNLGINGNFMGAANTYGFYTEFIPKKWVGIFFGFDTSSLKTNRQYIPIENFTQSSCLGINVLFGGR